MTMALGDWTFGIVPALLLLIGLVAGRLHAVRRAREGDPSIGDWLAALHPVAGFRGRHPGTSAWLAGRIDASSPRGFLLTVVVVAGGLCALLFGGLMEDVLADDGAVRLDPGITRFLVEHRTDLLTTLIRSVTWLGSNAALIPLMAGLVLFVGAVRRNVWGALLAALSLAGADALYSIVKPIVGRPRPPVAIHLVHASSFSFPSGHATAVTACFGMAAALLAVRRPLRAKVIAAVVAAIVIVVIGFSRIYLGVHWFTDVVAGVGLGGLWLCILWTVAILSGVPSASSAPRRRSGAPPQTAADRAA